MVDHADIDHTGLTGISSGNVATDTIWDAAGDLAVGSGANTAARLAIGAAGAALSRINGAVAWNSGTSNPGSAATGDRFWRTDLGLEVYFDGTRWVTTHLYREVLAGPSDGSATAALNGWPWTAASVPRVLSRQALWHTDFELFLVKLYGSTFVNTTNSGSHFYTYTLTGVVTTTAYGNFTTAADTPGVHTGHVATLNAAAGSTERGVTLTVSKTGTPGDLYGSVAAITYRLIVP